MNAEGDKQTQSQLRAMLVELNRNESRVLYERLKGMLTFQGFLFASVGISTSQDLFRLAVLICAVGGLVCIPWLVAVQVSYRGIRRISESVEPKYQQIMKSLPPLDAVKVTALEYLFLPEVFLPIVIGGTWVVLAYLIVSGFESTGATGSAGL